MVQKAKGLSIVLLWFLIAVFVNSRPRIDVLSIIATYGGGICAILIAMSLIDRDGRTTTLIVIAAILLIIGMTDPMLRWSMRSRFGASRRALERIADHVMTRDGTHGSGADAGLFTVRRAERDGNLVLLTTNASLVGTMGFARKIVGGGAEAKWGIDATPIDDEWAAFYYDE